MNNNSQKVKTFFYPRIPVLDLSDGPDMYAEFTTEALSFLMMIENLIYTIESGSDTQQNQETIYKIFHTIRGLSDFLNLEDISFLAFEAEKLLEQTRKGHLLFQGEIKDTLAEAISTIRKLLILLNEQINNVGELKSDYINIGPVIEKIRQCREKADTQSPAVYDDQRMLSKFKKDIRDIDLKNLEARLQADDQQPLCDKKTLRKLIQIAKEAKNNIKDIENKLFARQNELIKERDFAITLSQQAQGVARMKSNFLASVTHDIRTLITSILGFSDLLSRDALNEKQKERIAMITSSGSLLLSLVNNILDFSKIEQGKLKLESIEFDLDQLIDETINILSSRVDENNLKLDYHIEQNIETNLIGDPTRLKQVLLNLIDNAIKFTPSGYVTLKVMSNQQKERKDKDVLPLVFQVEDTGIGIPEEKKELIFESFTQADISTARQFGGSGLGLSICRSYVQLMGGKIWVKSKTGEGSTFIFTADFKKKKESIGKEASEKVISQKNREEEILKSDCSKARVLVAEDSVTNQELMSAYFESFGCMGDYASNGKEAIEKIKNNDYDMCLMDIQMPLCNGLEATRVIRRELNNKIPIIALTAAATEEEKKQCRLAGMTDHLSKPFQMIELKEIVLKYKKR